MNESEKQTGSTRKRKAPKTAWKPGQSGNPKGRAKKGETLTDILLEVGKKKIGKKDQKLLLAEKAWDLALKNDGDLKAIQFIFERIDGKPVQTQLTAEIDKDTIREI